MPTQQNSNCFLQQRSRAYSVSPLAVILRKLREVKIYLKLEGVNAHQGVNYILPDAHWAVENGQNSQFQHNS